MGNTKVKHIKHTYEYFCISLSPEEKIRLITEKSDDLRKNLFNKLSISTKNYEEILSWYCTQIGFQRGRTKLFVFCPQIF